jgi:hypothetical protein
VAGFISEWWPTSNRNGGRHQIGIPGRIESEFAIMANPNMTKREAVQARKAHSEPKNETKEMRRWFKDMIKRANKDVRDEKYLDVDPQILREAVKEPSVLNTLRKGGEAKIRIADGLAKIFDEPAPSGDEASLDTAA